MLTVLLRKDIHLAHQLVIGDTTKWIGQFSIGITDWHLVHSRLLCYRLHLHDRPRLGVHLRSMRVSGGMRWKFMVPMSSRLFGVFRMTCGRHVRCASSSPQTGVLLAYKNHQHFNSRVPLLNSCICPLSSMASDMVETAFCVKFTINGSKPFG